MTTTLSDADRAAIAAAKSSKGHAVGAYTQDERIYRAGLTAGRATALEEAAKVLPVSRADVSLMAGEMSAQEWRTASAILTACIQRIRALDG